MGQQRRGQQRFGVVLGWGGRGASGVELRTIRVSRHGRRGCIPALWDAVPGNSPIITIPTNGEGCVVLRGDPTFNVVGEISEVLSKKLFRRHGPLLVCITLGML